MSRFGLPVRLVRRRASAYIFTKEFQVYVYERVSKATFGKLLRDGVERIFMGFSECIDIILN